MKKTTKLPAAWQAYSTLFYKSKLKVLVDNTWGAYKTQLKKEEGEAPTESTGDIEVNGATSTKGQKKRKTCLQIQNKVVQAEYKKETPEVRKQVEDYLQSLKDEKSKSPEAEDSPDDAKLEQYTR